jgi:hypothetical protein
MAYTSRKLSRSLPLAGGVGDVASAALNVVSDPCLIEVATLVNRLHISDSGPTGASGPGIGLCSAVKPLRAVAYVSERPWIIPLGIGSVMALLVGVGYMLGKGGR